MDAVHPVTCSAASYVAPGAAGSDGAQELRLLQRVVDPEARVVQRLEHQLRLNVARPRLEQHLQLEVAGPMRIELSSCSSPAAVRVEMPVDAAVDY